MKMEYHSPSLYLSQYILGYYMVEGNLSEFSQKLSLWSRPFLIINYGDNLKVFSDEKNYLEYSKGISYSGVFTSPKEFGKNCENVRFVAVEFIPEVATHVFREDMVNLVESVADNQQMFKSLLWLCDALSDIPDSKTKLELLNTEITTFLSKQSLNIKSSEVHLLDIMQKTRGILRMKELKDKTGLSKNTLIKKYNQLCGTSPMQYAKIIRTEFAIARILHSKEDKLEISDLVYDLNYYDQSHFNHSIKSATGLSPLELNRQTGFECLAAIFANRLN
ncbi:MAG: AraC family transcriptional regulator [Leptospirales bacterium]